MSDARLDRAVQHWRLTLGEPLVGGTTSTVRSVEDDAGRRLVLKLPTARGGQDVTGAEAAALRAWSRTGAAVALVDATKDALLLERVEPGTLMPPVTATSLGETVGIAAALLQRLWAVDPGPFRFPTLAERYPSDDRVAREDAAHEQRARGEPDRGRPGVDRLPAAAVAAGALIATTASPVLLHGDFVTKNLLRYGRSPVGYVAIDPLPQVGDPAAEVAAFAAYGPADLIMATAETLAAALGADRERALRWAAIWMVHQTAQAWRDDQDVLESLVVSGPVRRLLQTRS